MSAARAAGAGGLPAAGRENPRRLLLGHLLRPDQGVARGRGAAAAGDDAGVRQARGAARRDRRGARGAAPLRRPAARRRRLGGRLAGAHRPRAARGRPDRALGDGDDDRRRLQPLRPPGDGLPGDAGAALAGDEQRAPGGRRGGGQIGPLLPRPPRPLAGADRRRLRRPRGRARSASPPTPTPPGGAAAAPARSRTP